MPSRTAVHSCEYGFSLESSSSLGEFSLETTSSFVFRTFTRFAWLCFGTGPNPSQFASVVVGGWPPLPAQPLRANPATITNNNRLLMAKTRVSRIRADGLVASPVVVNFSLASSGGRSENRNRLYCAWPPLNRQPLKVGWRGCTQSLKSSNSFHAGSGGSQPDRGA